MVEGLAVSPLLPRRLLGSSGTDGTARRAANLALLRSPLTANIDEKRSAGPSADAGIARPNAEAE